MTPEPEPVLGDIPSITYAAPGENVTVSRWQLALEFERARQRRRPHGEWALIPLAMFLGVLPYVITGVTFNDAYGLTASVWKAMMVLLAVATAAATVILAIAWCVRCVRRPERSSTEMVEDVLDRIEAANQRIAQREVSRQERTRGAAAS